MPPTIVGTATTASSAAATSLTLAKPAGLANGELLLSGLFYRNTPTDPNVGVTSVPAGFARVAPPANTNGVNEAWVKPVANAAGETATSYTFAVPSTNGANRAAGFLLRVAGADLTSPQDAAGTASATATAATVSVAANTLLCYYVAVNTASVTPLTVVAPPGMVKVAEVTSTAGSSSSTVALCVETPASSGPTGSRTATFTGGTVGSLVSFLFSLNPTPAPPESPGGWVAEGTGAALTTITGGALAGTASMRATKTFGSGLDTLRINDAGQLAGNVAAAGNTFSTLVRVNATGGTGWRIRMETLNGNVWQPGDWWPVTAGDTFELLYTPAPALLTNLQAVGFHLEATGVAGPVLLDIDNVRQGNYTAPPTPLQIWQAADQAAYAAVVAAGFTGPGRQYHAAGYNWSDAAGWSTANGAPWITAQASLAVRYESHLYYDNDDSGTYAASFATETTNAAGQGYASVADRAVARLVDFRAWLTTYGVAGVLGETGWPDDASWNPAGSAVISAAVAANIDVTYWAVGERRGTGYALSAWEWTGSAYAANPQATVLTAYIVAPVVIPAPSSTFPDVQVLMAIGGKALTDPQAAGIFVLNRSVLDGPDVLGTIAWVDVAADVKSFSVTPGDAGGNLDSASPTTFSLVLDNESGWYDPINPASPYVLDVGQQVWIRATHDAGTSGVVYGYVDDILPDYGWEPTVTVNCTDGLAMLGRADIGEIPPSFADDPTGTRIGRILNAALWPTSQRSIAAGIVTAQADTYGGSALSLIQRIVDTELGALFIDPDGQLIFYDRLQAYVGTRSTVIQAVLSDAGGDDVEMEQLPATLQRGSTYNEARVTRDGGVEQVASDATSIGKYGVQTFPGSVGVMAASDADAFSIASWVVARYKTPQVRFPQIVIDAASQGAWPVLLGLRRFDRVQLERDYGPVSFTRQLIVESVAHEVSATGQEWKMTLTTRDADAFTPFVLDRSLLDGAGQLI